MSEMMQGKNRILLFRKLSEQEGAAAKLVFQTSHTFSYNRSLDAIITKDGRIVKVGPLESEVSLEAIQAKNDPVSKMLKEAVIKGEKLELWEVSVDEELKTSDGKYPAVYAQGFLGSWEDSAGAEDEATVSSTFTVELEPQFGEATLTAEQEKAVQYVFKDTISGEVPGGVEG